MLKLKTSICKLSEQGIPCSPWIALRSESLLSKVELPSYVALRDYNEDIKHKKLIETLEELTKYYKKIRDAYGKDVTIVAIKAYPNMHPFTLAISSDTYIIEPENSQFSKDDCYLIDDIVTKVRSLYLKDIDTIKLEFMDAEENGHMVVTGVIDA